MENGAIYYGITSLYGGVNKTYTELVALHDDLLNTLTNYSSFSFSLSIGTDGTSNFIIDAATLSSFVNITLQLANDIGIISDDTYNKLVSSSLWQLAINVVASTGLSYGMSNLGYTSTSLGYLDNATAKAMFTSDIDAIFNTINVMQSVYSTYVSYEELQDAKDDLDQQRNEADEFLANLKSKEKKEFHDTEVYATGEYYRKFAGQDLFNVGLPGHAGYVPTSAQIPSWGIVQENLHDSDEFVSQVMNQNRNGSMAGGASFFKTITEGTVG
ncbi:MAG: hypothetical protein IBX43_04970 [Campylobacterales bacterium]|nr:hypothetical protein [Campylobacterales bacterium]